jgi:hypothetical protein
MIKNSKNLKKIKVFTVFELVSLLKKDTVSLKKIDKEIKVTGYIKEIDLVKNNILLIIDQIHKEGLIIDLKKMDKIRFEKIKIGDKVIITVLIKISSDAIKLNFLSIKKLRAY